MSYVEIGAASKSVIPESLKFWVDANKNAANALKPAKDIINSLPISSKDKDKLRTRPLDALIDILDPVEDFFAAAISKTIARKGATYEFFGKKIDVRVIRRGERLPPDVANITRSLRILNATIVLIWKAPVEFAQELANQGIKVTSQMFSAATAGAQGFLKSIGLGAAGADDAAIGATVTSILAAIGPYISDVLTVVLAGIGLWQSQIDAEKAKVEAEAAKAPPSFTATTAFSPTPTVVIGPSSTPSSPSRGAPSSAPQKGDNTVFILGGAAVLGLFALIAMRK